MYSLSTSFWMVPADLSHRDALLLGDGEIQREQESTRSR